jgi:ABC-type phosphate transport system auxiliary subunit
MAVEPKDLVEQAKDNLEKKRAFSVQVAGAVAVNLFMIAIWALSGMGYFWPAWVMVATVFGIGTQAWHLYGRKPITQADIDAEVERLQS